MPYLRVGSVAPDFSMADQSGKMVRLSDFRGRQPLVLMFYPADQTPGCTKQLCAARDTSEDYQQAGVAVYGVNPASAASHQRFVDRHGLSTPLLVDTGMQVAAKYDAVIGFGLLRLVNRTVVGIDRDGKIAFYKRGIPSTAEILAAFKSPSPTR